METDAFVDSVWRLIDGNPPDPDEPIILEAPPGVNLHELVAEFGRRAGQHRNVAAGGFVDPSLSGRTGLPLAEPFGAGELLEMRGWGYRNRWVGCGLAASPAGPRAVAVITHREDPAAAGFPQGASWAEKLRIVTGWEPIPEPRVDWPVIEADLGARLPSDYKEVVDLFGAGSFDEYAELAVPGGPGAGLNPWKRRMPRFGHTALVSPVDVAAQCPDSSGTATRPAVSASASPSHAASPKASAAPWTPRTRTGAASTVPTAPGRETQEPVAARL
ncbi:hypothetical protein [Streptomyces sp. NPDC014006]|uniref:hypothetical protein n=1 Tax=Streptomyces sp. NPDC014006 TaxID=3364870 RepID=UPI0036FC8FD7